MFSVTWIEAVGPAFEIRPQPPGVPLRILRLLVAFIRRGDVSKSWAVRHHKQNIMFVAGLILILILLGVLHFAATERGADTSRRRQTSRSNLDATTRKPHLASKVGHTAQTHRLVELSFKVPDLEGLEQTRKVTGSRGDIYFVSVQEQTCTCPDFIHREYRPKNHLGRLCKHLIWKISPLGAFENFNNWQKAIVQSGYGGPTRAWIVERTHSPPVLITIGTGQDWINVFANSKLKGETIAQASGSLREYGWKISEKRWSYGEAPSGARELRRILVSEQLLQMIYA